MAWPREAGISSPGLDHFVTAWGTGGELQRPDGEPVPLKVRMNLRRNQMTFRVPLDPGDATWRLVAGAGPWDADQGTWLGVMNLAFRFDEQIAKSPDGASTTFPGQGIWWEDGQATALARGTSGRFAADVDFGALARRERGFLHPPGRLQARVLGQGLEVHEGVRDDVPGGRVAGWCRTCSCGRPRPSGHVRR